MEPIVVANRLREAPSGRSTGRVNALDGLRGAAAALFVVHFSLFVLLPPPFAPETMAWMADTPLAPLINGQAPVHLFFVLSGFVLTVSLGSNPPFQIFAARRVARLLLPMLASVVFSFGLAVAFGGRGTGAGYVPWFTTMLWNEPWKISLGTLIGHMALTGRAADSELNPVLWFLAVELRLSLLMPLVAIWTRRSDFGAVAVAFLLGAAAESALLGNFGFPVRLDCGAGLESVNDVGGSILATVVVLPAFVAGSWLAGRPLALGQIDTTGLLRALVAGAAIIAVSLPFNTSAILGAVAFVSVALSAPSLTALLSTRLALRLGALSFPLTLIHAPVLLATINMIGDVLPRSVVIAGGLGGSLVVAEAFRRVVEEPTLAFARQIGRKR